MKKVVLVWYVGMLRSDVYLNLCLLLEGNPLPEIV